MQGHSRQLSGESAESTVAESQDNAVHLVDASQYVFRAWFALPGTLTGAEGQPINAVLGYAQFLCDFVARVRPGQLAFAFDESLTSSHRNDLYPAYKANRAPAPEELKAQFRACRELTEAAGFRYRYDESTGQFAHASAIMLLTPDGRLHRYFYGVEYAPRDVRLGIVDAGQGRIGSRVDTLLLYCFHYDPVTGRYGLAIMTLIRALGVATVAAIAAFVVRSVRRDPAAIGSGRSGSSMRTGRSPMIPPATINCAQSDSRVLP